MIPAEPSLVEVRFYPARPGKREELKKYLDRVVIPFNRDRGVDVIASAVDVDSEDGCVWIRRFADEKDRQAKYAAVYEAEEWRETIEPEITTLLNVDGIVVKTIAGEVFGSRSETV